MKNHSSRCLSVNELQRFNKKMLIVYNVQNRKSLDFLQKSLKTAYDTLILNFLLSLMSSRSFGFFLFFFLQLIKSITGASGLLTMSLSVRCVLGAAREKYFHLEWFMRELIELIMHGLKLWQLCSVQRVICVLITWRIIQSIRIIPYCIKSHPKCHQSAVTCTPLVLMNPGYPTNFHTVSTVYCQRQHWKKIIFKPNYFFHMNKKMHWKPSFLF